MTADRILVIDAGTSGLRARLVARDGAVTPLATEPWRALAPPDASPFARELDPADVDVSVARLLEAASSLRASIAGIAVTGQREGLVFADERGEALLISPNIDARASAEGMAIDADRGERVYATTGHLPSLMQAPAKLAWLRANRPSEAARVRTVVSLADWLAWRLTGEAACSRTLASENGLLNIGSGMIAEGLLREMGFDPALVPAVVAEGTQVGRVRHGPMAGTPVAVAGADTQCALAGAGVVRAGQCGIVAGWSAPVQLVTTGPELDAQRRIWTGLHVVPDRWVLESNAGDTGRAWDWVCALTALSPEAAEELAAPSPPGARDAVAVLGPRVMHAARMSAGVGAMTVPLPLVMTAPDRADVLRSVLEGIAFAVRANLEQIDEIAGEPFGEVALGGGMTRGALFPQIVADVLGRPVRLARSPETSSVGAAAVASPVFGLHATLGEAIDAMAAGGRIVEPYARAAAIYDDVYARWSALADALGSGEL